MSEMCCMRLTGNTGRKNYAKNRHLCTIAQLCWAISSQLRHVSTIGKNLLNSNIFSRCLHHMVNFGPLTVKIGWRVWGTPSNFNGVCVFASLLQTALTGGQPILARCLAISWAGTLFIHLWGSCPLTEFCQVQNSLCIQVLHSILAALLHGTRAAGISQNLCHATRNEITELSAGRPLRCASAHILVPVLDCRKQILNFFYYWMSPKCCGPGTTHTNDLQHISSQLGVGNSACQYVTRWCQLLLLFKPVCCYNLLTDSTPGPRFDPVVGCVRVLTASILL